MIAYLVVREGSQWRDVYRLTPGQTTTIGRAPTNQIILKDDLCSRYHAEVFLTNDEWVLRDLQSRNGTSIGGDRLRGDRVLEPGDIVRIGNCQLAFVYDLSRAFPESPPELEGDTDTITDAEAVAPQPAEPERITHRRGQTRLLSEPRPDALGRDRMSRELAQLYRLALEMGSAPDPKGLAEVVLNGLFEGTQADIGAILLLPEESERVPRIKDLQVVAYRSSGQQPYQRVSDFLSETVLREREAVLARDVADDSRLVNRDSLGKIHATSVICAPIRTVKRVFGLVHLYSTDPDRPLLPDDLEFTLAVADQCAVALYNLRRRLALAENLTQVKDEIQQLRERLGVSSELVGSSASMRRVTEQIARAAPTGATVLIRGESGVGKELVARAIHYSSPRRKGPFVCLNCAALSETLLESELFGHEKGAFTGATARKTGKFEAAHTGTIFLDEIGEMSPAIQAKFLRVLEGHSFERVGGSVPIKVDVRVVAATNRDLERAVEENAFRRDLYFRLHVVEVDVPPLRRHADDIPQLASHFLERLIQETGRKIRGFTPAAIERLTSYDWPGNVRELKNVVERAVVLCRGELIDADDILLSDITLPDGAAAPSRNFEALPLHELERRHILATLESTGWNKTQAAGILGIERSTLDRKLKRYRVRTPVKRTVDM